MYIFVSFLCRVVKEEIIDDDARLPCFNGRVVSWVCVFVVISVCVYIHPITCIYAHVGASVHVYVYHSMKDQIVYVLVCIMLQFHVCEGVYVLGVCLQWCINKQINSVNLREYSLACVLQERNTSNFLIMCV